MPIINGQFTVCWTANEVANTVDYVITGLPLPITGTATKNCTGNLPDTCCVNIPFTYNDPSCEVISIEVTIYSDCDPDNSITYSQEFTTDDQDCFMYEITCSKPGGCNEYNTLSICPNCVQNPGANTGVVNTYSITYDNSNFNTLEYNNYIPYNGTVKFCYDDLTRFEQIYGPPGSQEEYTIEPFLDGCCWECRRYQFTFDSREMPEDFGNGPGVRIFPDIYPMIVATSCSEVPGCYTPKIIPVIPNSLASVYTPYIFTGCFRKNSYTIIGNVYNVAIVDLGPCPTP